jgi:hypothetical protein
MTSRVERVGEDGGLIPVLSISVQWYKKCTVIT